MKLIYKILLYATSILFIPMLVWATPVNVDRLNNNHIEPLIKTDFVQAPYLMASSTTASSTFNGQVQITNNSLNIGTAVPLQLNGFGTGNSLLQVSSNVNDVSQINLWNIGTGATSSACYFLENNLTPIGGIGALTNNYGGFCFAGSNYNLPGFNALKPNGVALFATDGPLTIGSGSTNAASSSLYMQAGSGLDASYDAILQGGTGNFGIGSSSPTTRLAVNGTTTALKYIATSSGSATSPSYGFGNSINTGIYSTLAGSIGFTTAGVLRDTISSTGNLLNSGTYSVTSNGSAGTPAYRLGGGTYGMYFDGSNLAISAAGAQVTAFNSQGIGLLFGSAASPPLNFLTGVSGGSTAASTGFFYVDTGNTGFTQGGVESMRILLNGNIGIGTTSPTAKLSVDAKVGDTNSIIFLVASSTNGTATSGPVFLVNNLGNVGIGTSTPGWKFSVNGTSTAAVYIATTTATSSFAGDISTRAIRTTASSTLGAGINITAGCFAISNACVTSGTTLSGGSPNTLTYWTSGTAISATGSPTVGYIAATSTTATSTFAGALCINGAGCTAQVDLKSKAGITALRIENVTVADTAFSTFVTGDNFLRFSFLGDGTQKWAGGPFSPDVQLSRVASGTLAIQALNSATTALFGIGSTTPYATLSVLSGAGTGVAFAVSTTSGQNIGGYDNDGHRFTAGYTPVISTCGTGSPSITGDDQTGTITTGTAATACTMTFAKPYAVTPVCNFNDNSSTIPGDISAISTTAVTFALGAGLSGGNLYYSCAYHRTN